MKPRPNWATLYLRRRKEGVAPRGSVREATPEPPRDIETEVNRLAELRREREEWLRGVLDAEDDDVE